MSKEILVIGGGIVGLSAAYFLQKEGHQVTVIDQSDISSGASFVNAGLITPSHIIPLASPGMIAQGIGMMFDAASPFYMKPRWDTDFFKWAWYFHKSSTHDKVGKAIPVIKDFNILGREIFGSIKSSGDLGEFQLERKGLLMLYQTEAARAHEMAVAEKARFLNLAVSELDRAQLIALEPNVEIAAQGAIHYECDAHTSPAEFMPRMVDYLKNAGVEIRTNEEVTDITTEGSKVRAVTTSQGNYPADEVVLAAGSWSGNLAKKLRLNLPLQGGKGYRIDLTQPTGIALPAILLEAKIAVTPMQGVTRLAGTMEFSGINDIVRKERVKAIADGARRFYPELSIADQEIAAAKTGLRPVTPDGLPYIGRSSRWANLTIATGHAMMGWSLGPATGKLVAEIVGDRKTFMSIAAFSPNRRF